jgi:membrane carboxypeptidase/penicillin-binding protein PbpC
MEKISGITGAAPLFRDIMLTLHEKKEALQPDRPAGLERKIICPLSGALRGKECPGSMEEWFLAGTAPREPCRVHQRLRIDSRSGTLAGPATPAAAVQSRVFEIWPPEYQQWMQDCGLPAPPAPAANALETTLAVSFPDEGDIFKIDPILRRPFQNLMFEVVAPPGMNQVSLFLDDSLLTRIQPPFRFRWPLKQGFHVLRAEGRCQGGAISSRPVHFQVL